MVKKLLMLTVLMLGIVFTVSLKQLDASTSFTVTWVSTNYASTHYAMVASNILVPTDTATFTVTIPNSVHNTIVDITAPNITFTSLVGDLEYDMDVFSPTLASTYTFDLHDVDGFDLSDTTSITIWIPQSYAGTPSGYETWYTDSALMWWNKDAFKVKFYNAMTLYDTYTFVNVPAEPTDPVPPANTVFIGWQNIYGDIIDFTYISPDWFVDGELPLYAVYQSTADVEFDTGDPDINAPQALSTLLTAFGMNNFAGFIVIYVLLLTGITIGLLLLKLSAFIIILVGLILTAFFMFLGWLPVFASIIIMMVFGLGVLLSIRSRPAGENFE